VSTARSHSYGCSATARNRALAVVALAWHAGASPQSGAIVGLLMILVIAGSFLTAVLLGTTAVVLLLLWALPSRKWRHRDAAIRLAAVQGHRDRAVLRWVAAHDKDPAVRQAALERRAAL
jgi:hypothetical protein